MSNKKKINFVKMHGTGNDFILFDGEKNIKFVNNKNIEQQIKKLCDRHFGIGSDGLMYSEQSNIADIKMNYYNSDGSIGELCGNGIRCFAKFVYDENIIRKKEFEIETLAGIKKVKLQTQLESVKVVEVNIGKAIFEHELIPVNSNEKFNSNKIFEDIIYIDKKKFKINSVRVGVPHTVVFINNISDAEISRVGKFIENNSLFPDKTNVNFVKINNLNDIDLFTWERGAGRTLACGTGACASVVIGNKKKLLGNKVIINNKGGVLKVEIKNNEILLSGKAETVFVGQYLF